MDLTEALRLECNAQSMIIISIRSFEKKSNHYFLFFERLVNCGQLKADW